MEVTFVIVSLKHFNQNSIKIHWSWKKKKNRKKLLWNYRFYSKNCWFAYSFCAVSLTLSFLFYFSSFSFCDTHSVLELLVLCQKFMGRCFCRKKVCVRHQAIPRDQRKAGLCWCSWYGCELDQKYSEYEVK